MPETEPRERREVIEDIERSVRNFWWAATIDHPVVNNENEDEEDRESIKGKMFCPECGRTGGKFPPGILSKVRSYQYGCPDCGCLFDEEDIQSATRCRLEDLPRRMEDVRFDPPVSNGPMQLWLETHTFNQWQAPAPAKPPVIRSWKSTDPDREIAAQPVFQLKPKRKPKPISEPEPEFELEPSPREYAFPRGTGLNALIWNLKWLFRAWEIWGYEDNPDWWRGAIKRALSEITKRSHRQAVMVIMRYGLYGGKMDGHPHSIEWLCRDNGMDEGTVRGLLDILEQEIAKTIVSGIFDIQTTR